jgi:hypothetical protein
MHHGLGTVRTSDILAVVHTFFVLVCCHDAVNVLKYALGVCVELGYASFNQWIGGLGGRHSCRARNYRGGVSELASWRSLIDRKMMIDIRRQVR